ncbi:MAG: hypothetical protein JKX81_13390 [Arenicella sp.]|nr:hypothetical protein [Arenicella sp.]
MNMRTIAKVALLTLSLNLCAPVSASILITEAQYQELLPKTSGAVDYTIKLATNITVNYHCEIFPTPDGGYDIDRENCNNPGQFYNIDWQNQFPATVNMSVLDVPSTATIIEHKLWAIAFAHASGSSRIQMQHGLKKGPTGTFDLSQPFATGEMFGDYFDRQMNPNYFVSKGLQESSLGGDLPDNPMSSVLDDDGVLQIEYPGSAFSELQGIVGGGFPIPYAGIDPKRILSSNNGPARNILGSAVSSGFYNGSALAIVSGSLPWNQGSDSSQDSMHLFLQQSKDPDALSMIMSFMYNRGPYAAKDQVLNNQTVFDHCVAITEGLEDDPMCFTQQNDFGSRYIRQIPDVTNRLTLASNNPSTSYDSQITAADINNYLDLLMSYGLYTQARIDNAKASAMQEFAILASNGSISYRNDFGKVLEKILVQLPVYELGEGGQTDNSARKEIYFSNTHSGTVRVQTKDSFGADDVHEFVLPNNETAIDVNGSFTQLVTSDGTSDCTTEANTLLQSIAASLDSAYESLSLSIELNIDTNGCTLNSSPHTIPDPIKEGYWNPATLYQPSQAVIDNANCEEYINGWQVSAGDSPSVVYAADANGVWRPTGEMPDASCVATDPDAGGGGNDSLWNVTTVYDQPNTLVIDTIDGKAYRNEWYVTGGSEPSLVVAQTPYGAWRLVE